MRKTLLSAAAAIALVSGLAWAQTVYLQGAQQGGGVLSRVTDALGTQIAGIPYINANGSAATGGVNACRLVHTGGAPNTSATSANTNQTPVATEVYIAEMQVNLPCTATGLSIYNGSAVSGNAKVGLANAAGAVIATSASTATSGTTAYQNIAFTATVALTPGTYYALTFYDNNTQRATAWTAGAFGASKQTGQTYATGFTTITPPTTFTTALGPVASLY